MGQYIQSRVPVAPYGCWLGSFFSRDTHAQTKPLRQMSPRGAQARLWALERPRPQADHQGPAIAVIVNGKAYLVDAGVGVTRQADAAYTAGSPALNVESLSVAFITHLHSDQYPRARRPDLHSWIMGRTAPLELYGPTLIKAMAMNILQAYELDTSIRINGLEGGNATGYKVERPRNQTLHRLSGRQRESNCIFSGTWQLVRGLWIPF